MQEFHELLCVCDLNLVLEDPVAKSLPLGVMAGVCKMTKRAQTWKKEIWDLMSALPLDQLNKP